MNEDDGLYDKEEVEDLIQDATQDQKLDWLMRRMANIEGTMRENGLKRDVCLNSWFRRITIGVGVGIIIWVFTGV